MNDYEKPLKNKMKADDSVTLPLVIWSIISGGFLEMIRITRALLNGAC